MIRRSYFFKLDLLNMSHFSLISYLDSLPRKETIGINFKRGFKRYLPNKRATICVQRLILDQLILLMKITFYTKEVLVQGLDIIKIYSNIDILYTKSFRKSSNKLILDRSKWKYIKFLASYIPPKVFEKVDKLIQVFYSKTFEFRQVVIILITINVEEIKVAN